MSREAISPLIPAWLDDCGLTATEFRVLSHIWRRYGKDGQNGGAFPSGESIAAACRVNKDTVWKVIASLEGKKLLLRKSRSTEKGARTSNTYIPLVPLAESRGLPLAESKGLPPPEKEGLPLAETKGGGLAESKGYEGIPSKEPQIRKPDEGIESRTARTGGRKGTINFLDA